MAINFGTWEKYPLGEKLYVAELKNAECLDDDINYNLKYYKAQSKPDLYQRRAEHFIKLLDGNSSVSGANTSLFAPIDRSKENTDRMHAITLSMGADTGKRDRETNSYNAAVVPIFYLRHKLTGRYLAVAGGYTHDKERARSFYSAEEALKDHPHHQVEEA